MAWRSLHIKQKATTLQSQEYFFQAFPIVQNVFLTQSHSKFVIACYFATQKYFIQTSMKETAFNPKDVQQKRYFPPSLLSHTSHWYTHKVPPQSARFLGKGSIRWIQHWITHPWSASELPRSLRCVDDKQACQYTLQQHPIWSSG
jgi:hypothetical protein